jgi:ankyrin repeat protein
MASDNAPKAGSKRGSARGAKTGDKKSGTAQSPAGTGDEGSDAANRALLDAAFVCDLIKARQALEDGADPDARDEDERTPLFSGVLGGSVGLVGLLLESGADVNARDAQGFTPLHFAAQEVLPEMARLLIGKGADVNARDQDGSSVLWRAIFSAYDHEGMRNDVVATLVAAGANPDLANNAGETPRALAARLGNPVFTTN